jgi:hypothetical protein
MSELNENESYGSPHRSDSDDYWPNILKTQQINQCKQKQGIQRPKKLPKKIPCEPVDLDFAHDQADGQTKCVGWKGIE